MPFFRIWTLNKYFFSAYSSLLLYEDDPAMLNTLPTSPNILPSGERSCVRPRPRGAQPLNHNALRHGLYARRNPTPLSLFVNTFHVSLPGLESFPAMLEEAILSVRLEMARLFASQVPSKDLRTLLAQQRPILHLMGNFIRLQKALFRQQQPQRSLQLVAAHALALIRLHFRSNGITRDAYSFRENNKLSDFNSLPEHNIPPASSLLFLTPRQCRLLAPLLPSFSGEERGKNPDGVGFSPLPLGEGPGVRSGVPRVLPPDMEVRASPLPLGERPGVRSGGPGALPPDMEVRASPLPLGEGPGVRSGVPRALPPDMEVRATPLPLGEGPGVRSGEPGVLPPDMRVRSGRPPADPLPLLDAILWKLAHHSRWQDLPTSSCSPLQTVTSSGQRPGLPSPDGALPSGEGLGVRSGVLPPDMGVRLSMLTCRRYYRRLYLSGRLLSLLSLLFKDFLSTSGTDLPSLVSQGCFLISGNRLALRPDLEGSWQSHTALLFMQPGWQVLRRQSVIKTL